VQYRAVLEAQNFTFSQRARKMKTSASDSRQRQYDEKRNQMRLLDKFYKTSQHWFAADIFIELRTGATTVARIGRVDKYHQRKHSYRVQRNCGCVQQR